MGLLTGHDATIYRGMFKEMAKLLGIHVKYQYPIDMNFTIYAEETPRGFSEEIGMDIIFEENPKVSTLRKYGWNSEISDDKPYIATLPFDAKNLCAGCRITMKPRLSLDSSKTFVITEIHSNFDIPDSWICKLAPVFKKSTAEKLSDYKESNNVFMKLDD